MQTIDYAIARLKEEGTIRSLAIFCLAVIQGRATTEAIEAGIWAVLGLLSLYSALRPSKPPPAAPPPTEQSRA